MSSEILTVRTILGQVVRMTAAVWASPRTNGWNFQNSYQSLVIPEELLFSAQNWPCFNEFRNDFVANGSDRSSARDFCHSACGLRNSSQLAKMILKDLILVVTQHGKWSGSLSIRAGTMP